MNVENEMGVVCYFAANCATNGWEIVGIGARYPDAVLRDRAGHEYRAEFEFSSDNFTAHGHDPKKCDLIVCWERGGAFVPLPIIVLAQSFDIVPVTNADRDAEIERLRRALRDAKGRTRQSIELSRDDSEIVPPDGWRIELTGRGKYWQLRERGRSGRSRYGGKVVNGRLVPKSED